MRRRELIVTLGAAAAWPLVARAQSAVPVIGILFGGSAAFVNKAGLTAFHTGLGELGYRDGQNTAIESRFAEGRYERLPALAAELVDRKADVTVGLASPASLAAKAASRTIPVV